MTEKNTKKLSEVSRKPFMLGYAVKPIGDGHKSVWNKIGVAWAHKDDRGFEVRLDAIPLDGRVVLRVVSDENQNTGERVDHTPT